MKFENKISIDGISVLVVAVTAAIWLGNLDAKVNNLTRDSEAAKVHIEKLSDNQSAIAASLSAIKTQVNTVDKNTADKKDTTK
jgi:wobble nucleotide-excising tRNase